MDEVNYITNKYNFIYGGVDKHEILGLLNKKKYIYLISGDGNFKEDSYCGGECNICSFGNNCNYYTPNIIDSSYLMREEKLKRILE
jgi:hypothetical protein